MNNIKNIANSINSIPEDIDSEVIVADLNEMGFPLDKLMVKHEGLFMRNFSNDISDAYADMVNDLLILCVTRNSLYDVLPSGLFHHIINDFDREKRKIEFEKLKKEEENARKFFLPFDNEFFIHYVNIELELIEYLKNPGSFLKDLFFLDKNIPDNFAVKLISFLIYADQTIWDPQLTALLLSDIIGEDVICSVYYSSENLLSDETHSQYYLGTEALGSNCCCSGSPNEGRYIWEFTILLRSNSDINPYIEMENNGLKSFLKGFYEYFTPIEVEVRTRIVCDYAASFYLGFFAEAPAEESLENFPELFLGYNTMI